MRSETNWRQSYLPLQEQWQLVHDRLQTKIIAKQRTWPKGWLVRNDGREYKPHPGQVAFHESPARFRVLFGGRGSGKTTGGAQEALRNRIALGLPGAVINPDFENFKFSTWPELKKWIPWDRVVANDRRMGEFGWEPRGAFVIHFENGAVVYCKGLKDPDAARGPNINWLWYDEGGRDRTGMAWKIAIAGVRIGPSPAAWVTTTPRGRRHWTWKEFGEQDLSDEVIGALANLGLEGDNIFSWHTASIEDNLRNLDPMFYVTMKASYSGKFAQQELEGLVVDMSEGIVYDNFGPDNISVDADYTPSRGLVELGYDDGFSSSPRVFLFIQIDDEGIVNIFDELYHLKHQPATCISEAKDILCTYANKHMLSADGNGKALEYYDVGYFHSPADDNGKLAERSVRFEIAVGDPSAAQLRGAFREADIVARGPKGTIKEGIKKVYTVIRNDEGVIRLRVHPRCKNLIRELSEDYRWPEGSEGGDDINPVKEHDHGPDALRYWVTMRLKRAGV